jgi:MinD-like ATPase involved in chromosome partitioning or flagellar assembly
MKPLIPSSILGRNTAKRQTQPLVIAVSGPYGSTGKTTVAINLALELADDKAKVLLIDGDLEAGSVANHFLLSALPAGLKGAIRVADQNRFDLEQLQRLSVPLAKSSLVIMPGLSSPTESDVSDISLAKILDVARSQFDYTVIDLGWVGRTKPLLVSATFTESVLRVADRRLFVCIADPIGVFRLLATEPKLLEFAGESLLVMNRVRNSVIASAKKEIAATMQRLSQLDVACYLPDDPQHIDQALRTGVPSAILSRAGAFRQTLAGFVRTEILGTKPQLDSRVAKLG